MIVAVVFGVCLSACALSNLIAVSDVIEHSHEYDGKTLAVYGYVVVDSINIPHMFPSKSEAEKPRNDDYGIDLLPATHDLDVTSRYQKASCVVLSGVFHAPNSKAGLGLGTLTSRVGSIDFTGLREC
jgi:hypothetical protein